jgi:uncharacterized membrane protein
MSNLQSASANNRRNTVTTVRGGVSVSNKKNKNKQVEQYEQATFSGPMPPPALLEGYELLIPGAAERILLLAEIDAKHQQTMELAALNAAVNEVRRGQVFGFTIGLTALAAAMLALYLGSPTVAGIIGGATVVGLVSVFIVGRFSKI